MFTSSTIITRARAISAETTDATLLALYRAATGRMAEASFARALTVEIACATRKAKDVAAALQVGASQVSNLRKQVRVWSETGLSDAAVLRAEDPWTLVTSSDKWLNKWTTDEGRALMVLRHKRRRSRFEFGGDDK